MAAEVMVNIGTTEKVSPPSESRWLMMSVVFFG